MLCSANSRYCSSPSGCQLAGQGVLIPWRPSWLHSHSSSLQLHTQSLIIALAVARQPPWEDPQDASKEHGKSSGGGRRCQDAWKLWGEHSQGPQHRRSRLGREVRAAALGRCESHALCQGMEMEDQPRLPLQEGEPGRPGTHTHPCALAQAPGAPHRLCQLSLGQWLCQGLCWGQLGQLQHWHRLQRAGEAAHSILAQGESQASSLFQALVQSKGFPQLWHPVHPSHGLQERGACETGCGMRDTPKYGEIAIADLFFLQRDEAHMKLSSWVNGCVAKGG